MKLATLWVCGLIASGIFGAIAGAKAHYDGALFGLVGGVLAFISARLWYSEAAARKSAQHGVRPTP
jgi:hypothetical protein